MKKILIILASLLFMACQTTPTPNPSAEQGRLYASSKDGLPVYYSSSGIKQNFTLLFVHGLGLNSQYWQKQQQYFSKNHQVVLLDLAGHGWSDSNRKQFSIQHYSEDINAVINTLGLTNVVLISQSIGSAAALESSLQLPDKIVGHIAVNTFNPAYSWPSEESVATTLKPFKENFYQAAYPLVKKRFASYTDKALIYKTSKEVALMPADIGFDSLKNFYHWLIKQYPEKRKQLHAPLIHINTAQQENGKHAEDIYVAIKASGYYTPIEASEKFNHAVEQALKILTEIHYQ